MTPAKHDLEIYQGDDFTIGARFSADGTPFDLTGWTFAAQIRTDVADVATTTSAVMVCAITAPPTAGAITITLPHTASLPLVPLKWDLQGTDPTGTVTTFVAGKVKVTGEVTRP